mgnify:CR=1 FL=1
MVKTGEHKVQIGHFDAWPNHPNAFLKVSRNAFESFIRAILTPIKPYR